MHAGHWRYPVLPDLPSLESERLFATTEVPETTSIEGVFRVNTEPLDRRVVESMMQSLEDVYALDDETVRHHLRELASI